MSSQYQAVQWNRQKRIYDLLLISGVALYLVVFAVVTEHYFPYVTEEILIMRAFGTLAFLLLHLILCIGPLCRLNPKFLCLLYNRRHMGVTCFFLGLIHAVMVVATYHAGGDINPIASIFVTSRLTGSLAGVPFQPFGFFALCILFLMAATSHDFWLSNLTPPIWKTLHMLVYAAYFLLVLHVTFGVLQGETGLLYSVTMAAGLLTVIALHKAAAWRERRNDRELEGLRGDGFCDACSVDDIPENRARVVCLSGERVAIFKYDGKISAVSNVCQHQNGPLGEGKIVFGCITCPWHGYQYRPETGESPPPFKERVATYDVRVQNGRVFVFPKPKMDGMSAPAILTRQ